MPILFDRRRSPNTIWNAEALAERFHLAPPGVTPQSTVEEQNAQLDAFLYRGYRSGGTEFLRTVEGRFACAHWDQAAGVIFLARDWIGEQPFQWIATPRGFAVANTIRDLQVAIPDWYSYRYTRAFPQAKCLEIEVSEANRNCVSETSRYVRHALYDDFVERLPASPADAGDALSTMSADVRAALLASAERRMTRTKSDRVAVLLSGGLDSLSVALVLRELGAPIVAYTLAVGEGGDDVQQASVFARQLGIEHRVVRVTPTEAVKAAPAIVEIGETYHLFNFYCTVGMYFLGRQLADDGITTAYCGEAVNEALGDYHDWEIQDSTGARHVIQHVPFERMRQPGERLLYVWGQAHDRGKYNHQLGTGLAKHAGSRMFKPFLHFGLRLDCPYYDRSVLAPLVSLNPDLLDAIGGKPGLFLRIFKQDLVRHGISEEQVAGSQKVRLQDASDGGRGGLSPVLLGAGYDQKWLIQAFDERFGADLNPELERLRLGRTTTGTT